MLFHIQGHNNNSLWWACLFVNLRQRSIRLVDIEGLQHPNVLTQGHQALPIRGEVKGSVAEKKRVLKQ